MVLDLMVAAVAMTQPTQDSRRAASIDAIRSATVLIEVLGPRGRSTGSGFLVSTNGTVATAAHVIKDAWVARVRFPSGQMFPILGAREVDEQLDLALLALPAAPVVPVDIGDSDSLRVGQRLLALGCPFGLEVAVADGLLSAVPTRGDSRMLQVSIPVSPGSSGGPVFTEDGRVIGLVVSGMRGSGAENINFALPFNYVRGRIGPALGKTPTPLAELARTDLSLMEAIAAGEERLLPLPPINAGLAVNFGRLDGLEVGSRWKQPNGRILASVLKVGLTMSPTGEVVVERLRRSRLSEKDENVEVGREVHRTLFRIGADNFFSSAIEFTPTDGRAQGYGMMLEVRGEQYLSVDMKGAQRAGRVPRGALPPALADLVLGGQDQLPEGGLRFQVLDPLQERLLPARFEFTGRARRKIPIAKPGTSCEGKPNVKPAEVEVLLGTQEIGFDRKEVAVLTTTPFLVLDEHVTCVRLPRPSGGDDRVAVAR